MIKKTNHKKLITYICVAVAVIIALSAVIIISFSGNVVSRELSVEEAQKLVDDTFENLPKSISKGAVYVVENSSVTVKSVSKGIEKNLILKCEYNTIEVGKTLSEHKQDIVDKAYMFYMSSDKSPNATSVRHAVSADIEAYLKDAEKISGEVTLELFETNKGKFVLYLSDEAVNTCLGGFLTARDEITAIQVANYGDGKVDISKKNTVRNGIKDCIVLKNYDSDKPATGNFVTRFVSKFLYDFHRNFIQDNRWMYLVQGLGTTLAITALAGILGMILGFIVAIIRCTNETTGKFVFVDRICRLYLTVVRGTPVMVQLLIIYFVLLLPIGVPKFISAVLCFGLNSGAYVAEIVRGGIMSVDKGQNEAGRSLGFNFPQTMIHFIIPQAFKAVLPALANEFITLLKESSVAFYIGVADLTQGGLKIRSLTFSSFMPLIAVALIYLVIVLILTRLVGMLERRLRKSDH